MQLNNINSTKKLKALTVLNTAVIVFLVSILFVSSAAAEEITLKEAINHGLKNNLELKEQQNIIASTEGQLKIIRAQQGWQIEVSADYTEIVDQPENNSLNTAGMNINNLPDEGGNSSLSINRNFSSGLYLSQTAEVDDQGESDYTVNISYPLFKGIPTESEKSYYQREQELLKAQNNLSSLIEDKILVWLENYLQLIRLEKSKENKEIELKTAETIFLESKRLYADAQISESELKSSEAEYIDAEKNYLEISNQLNNSLRSFKLQLNLTEDREIKLDRAGYLDQISSSIIDYHHLSFEEMYQSLMAADYELKSAAVNLELQKKQLQWFQNEGRANVNLSGSYNYSSETSTVGLVFSYDLFDGGQREFNEQNLKSNLQLAEANYNNLKKNKKLELESQLNRLKIAERGVKSAELKLDNAENNYQLASEQYQAGLITEKTFEQQKLAYQQSQINYQQAADNLFIEKLNLNMLINKQEIANNRGVEK